MIKQLNTHKLSYVCFFVARFFMLSFIKASFIKSLFAATILLISIVTKAEETNNSSNAINNNLKVQTIEALTSLAQTQQWLKLLQYRDTNLLSGMQSEIDDPRFFLSENGKTNPQQELTATINTFVSEPVKICKFPARYLFLRKNLPFMFKSNYLVNCTEYNEWKNQINAKVLTLVFPAAYLNNPSSMFGHLFLRIDKSHNPNDQAILLSSTVNYGANVNDNDGGGLFVIKGLTGAYGGTIAILPYYEKVKTYSDIENRDIWEYPLTLSDEQLERFVAHLWELQTINFDYFFFDENCAYRILTLLEVAVPEIDLTDSFSIYTIPTDSIRELYKHQLIDNAVYRPSLTTQLTYYYDQLNPQGKSLYKQYTKTPNKAEEIKDNGLYLPLSDSQKLLLSTSLSKYSRNKLNKLENKDEAENYAKLAYQSLLLNSDLATIGDDSLTQVPVPEYRDDQGHETFKVAIGSRYSGDDFRVTFNIRPAFQNLTDPVEGYLKGAQIDFLNTTLSYDGDNLQVDNFNLLTIQSLTPVNAVQNRWSWGLNASYQQYYFDGNDKSFAKLKGNIGKSYEVGNGYLYALATAGSFANATFNDFFSANIGAKLGYVYFGKRVQFNLFTDVSENILSSDVDEEIYQLDSTLKLSKNNTVDFTIRYVDFDDDSTEEFGVSYNWFF